MDRVTVLCCTNMAGTDKKIILIIGKSANPRCFKGIQRDALPVTYFANRNAWMTAAIFTEWLSGWNDELVASGREVLLFIDNCSAHPSNCNFSNINLQFLPPNTTSILQPLDMGIITTSMFVTERSWWDIFYRSCKTSSRPPLRHIK